MSETGSGSGGASRVAQVGRAVVRQSLVEPVAAGRLRDLGWPPGLRVIVGAGYLMFALAGLLVITSGPIRASSPLVLSGNAGVGLPVVAVGPLVVLLSFGLAAFMTATLHGPWWLTILGLALTLGVTGSWSLRTPGLAGSLLGPVLAAGVVLALAVVVLVRRRRPFVWWEFAVLWALTGAAMVVGVVEGRYGARFGQDVRPASLQLTAVILGFLALPAATAAGAAVADITVRATLAATRSAQRLTGRVWPYGVLAALVLGRVAQVGVQLAHRDPVTDGWTALVPALALVAALAAVGFGLLRIGRRPDAGQVEELPAELGRVGFTISVALVAALVPVLLLQLGLQLLVALAPSGAAARSSVDLNPLLDRAVDPLRALIGLVLLVLAVVEARRGRSGRAVVLGSIAVLLIALARSLFLADSAVATLDPDAINLVCTLLVLVTVAVLLSRRALTPRRALAHASILILSALFSYRDFISDPVGALLGFSGAALVLFGLTWDLFTGAGWGNGDSRRFARPTRVLLVLTNSVLTMMVLAFAALVRDGSQTIYLDRYAELGDFVFGTALLAAAVITVYAAAARDRPVG